MRKGGFRKAPFGIFRAIYNLTSKIAFLPIFMRLPNVAIREPAKTLDDSLFRENGIEGYHCPNQRSPSAPMRPKVIPSSCGLAPSGFVHSKHGPAASPVRTNRSQAHMARNDTVFVPLWRFWGSSSSAPNHGANNPQQAESRGKSASSIGLT